MQQTESIHRSILFVALIAAIAQSIWLIFDRHGTAWIEFPLDDAWIHLVYVRALLTEWAPNYNPGMPESGFTSPLWLFALMPFYLAAALFHLPPAVIAKMASWLFGLLTAITLARLVWRVSNSRLAAWLTSILLMVNPDFTFSMLSGMEITLTACLMVLLIDAWLTHHFIYCGRRAALSLLARPEAAIAVIALVPLTLIGQPGWRRRLIIGIDLLLPALILGLLWLIYYVSHDAV